MEVEHVLGAATPAAFSRYVTAYGRVAVPGMIDLGFDVCGAWRQVTGPLGRDLLLLRFDSAAAQEQAISRITPELAEKLQRMLREVGTSLKEERKTATPILFDERRRSYGAAAPGAPPRTYRMVRRRLAFGADVEAVDALVELVEAVEKAGSWKLFAAYRTVIGHGDEMTEIWISGAPANEWFDDAAPPAAIARLDSVTLEATLSLLEPLPYSKAR